MTTFFGFLPISYQIDIRRPTAGFLETFMINDNGICMLFERHAAKIGRNKIFSTCGDVHSVSDLRCAIDELFFFLLVTVSIVINPSYCLEVDYLLNSLFTCQLCEVRLLDMLWA